MAVMVPKGAEEAMLEVLRELENLPALSEELPSACRVSIFTGISALCDFLGRTEQADRWLGQAWAAALGQDNPTLKVCLLQATGAHLGASLPGLAGMLLREAEKTV